MAIRAFLESTERTWSGQKDPTGLSIGVSGRQSVGRKVCPQRIHSYSRRWSLLRRGRPAISSKVARDCGRTRKRVYQLPQGAQFVVLLPSKMLFKPSTEPRKASRSRFLTATDCREILQSCTRGDDGERIQLGGNSLFGVPTVRVDRICALSALSRC